MKNLFWPRSDAEKRWIVTSPIVQPDVEDRFARAVLAVEKAAAYFAVLTQEAQTVSDAIRVRTHLGRLVLVLQAQEQAALLKAETLCR